jgi:translation initiation factor IF-1
VLDSAAANPDRAALTAARSTRSVSAWVGVPEPGGVRKDRFDLARDDLIQATGSVDKILGGGRYQITLENGQIVTAQLSGRMRRFRIRVIPGDRVTVGLSPYDPTHGFITFRLKEGQAAPGQ